MQELVYYIGTGEFWLNNWSTVLLIVCLIYVVFFIKSGFVVIFLTAILFGLVGFISKLFDWPLVLFEKGGIFLPSIDDGLTTTGWIFFAVFLFFAYAMREGNAIAEKKEQEEKEEKKEQNEKEESTAIHSFIDESSPAASTPEKEMVDFGEADVEDADIEEKNTESNITSRNITSQNLGPIDEALTRQDKVYVIQAVHTSTSLDLKESEDLVDGAMDAISKGEVEAAKAMLEESGAGTSVEIIVSQVPLEPGTAAMYKKGDIAVPKRIVLSVKRVSE